MYKHILNTVITLFLFAPLAGAEVTSLKVDTEKSYISWLGSKVAGQHNGKVFLKEGIVELDQDRPVGGSFTIDMGSIQNEDLEPGKWRNKLENHLKSDDFFNISQFPIGKFDITEVLHQEGDEYLLNGNLTVKGINLPVSLPATIKKQDGRFVGSGKLTIDRSKWDIRYNSGKFFDASALGDKLIYDDIAIEVNIVAPIA